MFGFLKNTREVEEDVQGEFIERVHIAAEEFVAAVPDNRALDYSLASVGALDTVLGQAREGVFTVNVVQAVGAAAYLYEVARRHFGGQYEVCDDDDPVVLVTGEPEFSVCLCAIKQVERRLSDGAAESLPAFFQRYVDAVSARKSSTIS